VVCQARQYRLSPKLLTYWASAIKRATQFWFLIHKDSASTLATFIRSFICTALRWVHTCNVTAYRNTVSWQCGRDSWPRNVSKVGYAITLRACSVRCRYLAVASKGWYGYSLSRSGLATWHITTVRTSRLLYIRDASGSHNKLETPRCNARRILLRHEARDESSDRNSVSCQSLATLLRYSTR
jgi:hypothetical protein